MIGMMNVGSDDVPIEFYNAMKQSSLYERKPSKDNRTYDATGRVYINGIPVYHDTPEDMWQETIHLMMKDKMFNSVKPKPKGGRGPLAVLRRLTLKLPLSRSASLADKKKTDSHVTLIRISSLHNTKLETDRPTPIAHKSFDKEEVLGQLMLDSGVLEHKYVTIVEEVGEEEQAEGTSSTVGVVDSGHLYHAH